MTIEDVVPSEAIEVDDEVVGVQSCKLNCEVRYLKLHLQK